MSACLAFLSLFAVVKAPALPFWYVALGATEWGHWLAAISAIAAVRAWRKTPRGGPAFWLALGAAVLFLSPLYRATRVSRGLPQEFATRFGVVSAREGADAPPRRTPLDPVDLVFGVRSPPVHTSSRVYEIVDGKPLELDLFQPTRIDRPLPGLLVIHGGSWQSGDRREFEALNRYLAARGYLVAAIDYRLAPAAVFPAPRDDVFVAIRYLKEHAAELGFDNQQLVLLGRSAGGQIALSAAYAGKDPAIKGAVVFYAPNDLGWAYAIPANPLIMNSQKVIAAYLGGTPERAAGIYAQASPLRFVNTKTPPTLMIHGDRDELVWAQHEERLAKRLTEVHRPFFYLRLPWATHGCDANFSGPCGQLSTYAIERFLAAVMPPPAGAEALHQMRGDPS